MRISWLAVLVLLVGSPTLAQDADEDGVSDAVERDLISLYRPHLYYDAREDNWPATIVWFTQQSELQWRGNTVFTRAQMAADFTLALHGQDVTGAPSTTIGQPQALSDYNINPDDGIWGGQGPFPIGMYGHVVPIIGPVMYIGRDPIPVGRGDLLVQYWQFFAFNDSQFPSCCHFWCGPCNPGDHEGDWVYLDVYVEGTAPYRLKYIVYHHHGDNTCPVDILPWDGALPQDGIPRCYLEESAHEWHPEPGGGDAFGCAYIEGHEGNGVNYRSENILNVGERFAPMPDPEAELFMLFNGKWGDYSGDFEGDPPDPPAFQRFPGFIAAPLVFAHVNGTAEIWTLGGLGSRYHPFRTIGSGIMGVERNGSVVIEPGTYNETFTVNLPGQVITLTAPNGPVTIGR